MLICPSLICELSFPNNRSFPGVALYSCKHVHVIIVQRERPAVNLYSIHWYDYPLRTEMSQQVHTVTKEQRNGILQKTWRD